MIKQCKICGKDFDAKGSGVYCSEECRRAGSRQVRKAWEESSDYHMKKRLYVQKVRQREKEEKERARREERSIAEERSRAARQVIIDAAKVGDPTANMLLRASNKYDPEYWRYYQIIEISRSESDSEDRVRHVNGISVLEDDFVALVLNSIEAVGLIRSELIARKSKPPYLLPKDVLKKRKSKK